MTDDKTDKIISQLEHLIVTTEAICSYLGEAHQRYLDAERDRTTTTIPNGPGFANAVHRAVERRRRERGQPPLDDDADAVDRAVAANLAGIDDTWPTTATTAAPIIRVVIHLDPDSLWAESPDLPNWTAVSDDYGDLRELIREGIEFVTGKASTEYTIVYQEHTPRKED